MSETHPVSRTVDVLDATGEKTGSAELPAELFDVTANIPLIHQVVVAQLAAARQGTHSTKTRSEVRGGGAKPYRQKGTGRARQGSIRAPQYVGGGVVHGPQPRGYAQRTPKKMIAAALRGALSDRARDGRVLVISELVSGDLPSTKSALAALAKITDQAGSTKKVLVVLHRDEDLAWLSLRNAATVEAIAVGQLNAYDVLVADAVVFTRAALEAYVSGPAKGRSAKAVGTSAEPTTEHAELVEAPIDRSPELVEGSGIADLADAADDDVADEVADGEEPRDYGPESFRGEEPPSGYDIKGNEDSMKFHTPESPYYTRTIAEVWFSSVEAAEAAGFSNVQGDAGADGDDEEDDK
jgi:large subunit ribosomal protein L4